MAGAAESRLKRAAKKMGFTVFPCASSTAIIPGHNHHSHNRNNSGSGKVPRKPATGEAAMTEDTDHDQPKQRQQQLQSLCVICLEPLVYRSEGGGKQAIFTGQCMHSFHFICISSVVHHGGVTCPICRAEWAQLPCNVPTPSICHQQATEDPVLRFLNDSIDNIHSHRGSPLSSAVLYDDDDPVEPVNLSLPRPRLQISLSSLPTLPAGRTPPTLSLRRHPMLQHHPHCVGTPFIPSPQRGAIPRTVQSGVWLSARLSHRQATDFVLVASPNGPHLLLFRQSMAVVVFSLRPVDRLAIITHSPATATRALPLRRMTSRGKRMALQVIDRVFYLGEADPLDALQKGAKVLEDRTYQNPMSCILHLSDSPTLDCAGQEQPVPFPVHHFHVGFRFGTSNGFVMYEFKEFLSRLLGDVIRETQMRVGEEGHLVTLGELRVGEERRIPLALTGDCSFLRVGYSYIEGGGVEECPRTGEVVVGVAGKDERDEGGPEAGRGDLRMEGMDDDGERWASHLDPFMTGRWVKHLHGYRARGSGHRSLIA